MQNSNEKIMQRELSYQLNGILFSVHNKLGRFAREKQYGDLLASMLENNKVEFIYTKNFIIIIDYLKNWNENYNLLLPDALLGIKDFFKLNFNNL